MAAAGLDLDLEKDQAALISKAKWWPRKLPIMRVRWVFIPEYPREYSATGGYSGLRGVCRLWTTQVCWQTPNTRRFKQTAKKSSLLAD